MKGFGPVITGYGVAAIVLVAGVGVFTGTLPVGTIPTVPDHEFALAFADGELSMLEKYPTYHQAGTDYTQFVMYLQGARRRGAKERDVFARLKRAHDLALSGKFFDEVVEIAATEGRLDDLFRTTRRFLSDPRSPTPTPW